MARRKAINRNLPQNLYVRKGYFSWRNPNTGIECSVGKDRSEAIAQAVEANIHILCLRDKPRLIDRLTGAANQTVSSLIDEYTQFCREGKAASTIESERQRVAIIREKLGSIPVKSVTTQNIADFLRDWLLQDKRRMAEAQRSLLRKLFVHGISIGWVDRNPVDATRTPKAKVKRARLVLEDFRFIFDHGKASGAPQWLLNAIRLSIVTGQRREDLAAIQFKDVHDGRLWVIQQKTGNRVAISTTLTLQALGWTLKDVIQDCRDSTFSRVLVHHTQHVGRAKPGDSIRLATITAGFAQLRDAAVAEAKRRKRTDLFLWTKNTVEPPSFHEIRSLAARLYDTQGVDAQKLLGHKHPSMTELYKDVRGAEWLSVDAA